MIQSSHLLMFVRDWAKKKINFTKIISGSIQFYFFSVYRPIMTFRMIYGPILLISTILKYWQWTSHSAIKWGIRAKLGVGENKSKRWVRKKGQKSCNGKCNRSLALEFCWNKILGNRWLRCDNNQFQSTRAQFQSPKDNWHIDLMRFK